MTKISSSLPQGEGNGLTALARQLIDSPHDIHVIIALLDCKQITTDNDSGEIVPTARIRRVEPIVAEDRDTAAHMLRRALERRTGKSVLPFDLEEDVRNAFGNVDPNTGEIL